MTDIDFDELDKAVNSLMGDDTSPSAQGPAVAPPKPQAVPALDLSSAAAPSPAATPAETSPAPQPQDTSARPAGIVTKRRGQFMDVMHPSAKMAAASPRTPSAAAQVSRQGASLTPSTLTPPTERTELSTATPAPTPVQPATIAPPAAPEWPDPIDLATETAALTIEPTAPEASTPLITPTPETIIEPLSSPFLPDAKVEKRPLGSAPTIAADAAPEPPAAEQTPADDTAPLPAELSGGVLAVESNDLTETADKPADTAAPAAADPPTPSGEPPAPSEPPAATPANDAPSGPTSIPPQYKTEQTKEPVEHTALYDTVSEASAAAKPAKKKHGWLVPVAIVLLIILGCAGGVAVYYAFL